MKKSEIIIIQQAIKDLTDDDGDFHGAISKLCGLVGMIYPAGELGDLRPMSLSDLMGSVKNGSEFQVVRHRPTGIRIAIKNKLL